MIVVILNIIHVLERFNVCEVTKIKLLIFPSLFVVIVQCKQCNIEQFLWVYFLLKLDCHTVRFTRINTQPTRLKQTGWPQQGVRIRYIRNIVFKINDLNANWKKIANTHNNELNCRINMEILVKYIAKSLFNFI